ncbi:MAG: hypothetical protein LBT04_10200 [Prevotellaceae bacterium]|jgi:hypothetical protein|nr:hypothetical protein [Prevotellaceae bacterium]
MNIVSNTKIAPKYPVIAGQARNDVNNIAAVEFVFVLDCFAVSAGNAVAPFLMVCSKNKSTVLSLKSKSDSFFINQIFNGFS